MDGPLARSFGPGYAFFPYIIPLVLFYLYLLLTLPPEVKKAALRVRVHITKIHF